VIKSNTVYLRKPCSKDQAAVIKAYSRSASLHKQWTIPPANINFYLSQEYRYFVCKQRSDEIVGTFNLSEIVRGRLQSAFLGYEAFVPHQHKGYMFEGMRLLLSEAFGPLNLHRIEANIQPENYASKALAKKSGFRQEGLSPQYLFIAGKWCDHERWAIINPRWKIPLRRKL